MQNEFGLVGNVKVKVTGYGDKRGRTYFYVSNELSRFPVAVHPDLADELSGGAILGVTVSPRIFVHSSNYGAFPRGLTSKGQMQHRACQVDVSDVQALKELLTYIGATAAEQPEAHDALADISDAEEHGQFGGMSMTERDAIVKARLGQGRFRDALKNAWSGRCAVTGVAIDALLRASHIKPWRHSNNRERLDADNGLLLVATLDAAFDAGLMSFDDAGGMVLSSRLGRSPEAVLGILSGARLRSTPTSAQQEYLRHHRNQLMSS